MSATPRIPFESAEIHRVVSKAGTSSSKRWMLLNKELNSRCLAGLLGIGNGRLQRTSSGHLDMRFRCYGVTLLDPGE